MKKIILLCTLLQCSTILHGEIGCMDNSKHMDYSDGPDYKEYHYVQCNCECSRYAQSFNRGRCERCWHYRSPRPLEFVGD